MPRSQNTRSPAHSLRHSFPPPPPPPPPPLNPCFSTSPSSSRHLQGSGRGTQFINPNPFSAESSFTLLADNMPNNDDPFLSDEETHEDRTVSEPTTPGPPSAQDQRKRNRDASGRRTRSKRLTIPSNELGDASPGSAAAGALTTPGSNAPDDELEKYRQFDVEIRWQAFLFGNNKNADEVIKSVYSKDLAAYSNTYQAAKTKLFSNVKAYKGQVLQFAEEHLEECVKANFLLKNATDDDALHTAFDKLYSPTNFYFIFRYMKKLVDVDGSSELGQYFCKNVYINLMKQMKHYWDAKQAGIGKADAREELLSFYDLLPNAEQFDYVDKHCFKERPPHEVSGGNSEEMAKKKAAFNKTFRATGPPPPPPPPSTGAAT